MSVTFSQYGFTLEYIEPEQFYAGNYTIYKPCEEADDGNDYDIILNGDATEFYCTNI